MESGENSSSMQSSSTAGGGGDDQEYETTRGGGGGIYSNYNLVFNNSNINDGSVDYTTSPTMLLINNSNMMSTTPSPQLPPWSFGDPNFHNSMVWQHPQPQPQVVAAGTSCTTNLVNHFRPHPNQSPFAGDSGRDSLLSPSLTTTTTATIAAESVACEYHATNPPPPLTAAGIGMDIGMSTGTGTCGSKTSCTSGSKNPRKRTRASRRAPTTVLTTDTNNFRAMVQEFTGIPSSPFSPGPAASPLLSNRLSDLFTTSVPIPGSSAFGLGPSSSSLSFRPPGYTTDLNHLSNLIRPTVANASAAPTIQKPIDHHHRHPNYSSSSSISPSDLRFHTILSAPRGMTTASDTQQPGLSTVSNFQQLMMGSSFNQQMLMSSTTDHNFHLSGSGNGSTSGDFPDNKADTNTGNQTDPNGGDDDNRQ